jgi:hypothetical protein
MRFFTAAHSTSIAVFVGFAATGLGCSDSVPSAPDATPIRSFASYQCTVLEEATVDDNGKVQSSKWRTPQFSKFSVSRSDGRIIGGAGFDNENAETTVLDRGGTEFGFKVVSVWGDLGEFRTLVVKEMAQARSKPFVMSDSLGDIYTGLCE